MRLLLALAALLPLPAFAQDRVTPADLVDSANGRASLWDCPRRQGADDAYWQCLRDAGLSDGALDFAQWLGASDHLPGPGFVVALTELGEVDLAQVVLPFLANTNDQSMLVNGSAGAVQPALGPRPEDAQTSALIATYPTAGPAFRMSVVAYREYDGIQRFIVSDEITDGCRACEHLGSALAAMEFENGTLTRVEPLGWLPAEVGAEGTMEPGDLQSRQIALTLHGYQPGGMDGVPRPETDAALTAFAAEHCLENGARGADLDGELYDALYAAPAIGPAPVCD